MNNAGFITGFGFPQYGERTPFTHPYSYDEFIIYDDTDGIDRSQIHANYSDRLYQWDYRKFDMAMKQTTGDTRQRFSGLSVEQLSKFLQLYHDDTSIRCVKLVQGCNQSNGYPYWILFYVVD
jgi:hypothetical protein